jgi:hypothetical protein
MINTNCIFESNLLDILTIISIGQTQKSLMYFYFNRISTNSITISLVILSWDAFYCILLKFEYK